MIQLYFAALHVLAAIGLAGIVWFLWAVLMSRGGSQ